jgi:hypothetical protein
VILSPYKCLKCQSDTSYLKDENLWQCDVCHEKFESYQLDGITLYQKSETGNWYVSPTGNPYFVDNKYILEDNIRLSTRPEGFEEWYTNLGKIFEQNRKNYEIEQQTAKLTNKQLKELYEQLNKSKEQE